MSPPNERDSRCASPETRAWVARQREMAAAAAADREYAAEHQRREWLRLKSERQNPAVLPLALAVLALLLMGGWYLIDRMQCDPFYADHAGRRGGACR